METPDSSSPPQEKHQSTLSSSQDQPSPSNGLPPPPDALSTTCASLDRGGGVSYSGAFLIYTTVLPPSSTSLSTLSTSPSLLTLSSTLTLTLPILPHTSPLNPSLITTLPSPPHTNLKPKPHYFLNAAAHTSFALVGPHDPTTTLLALLRRPWCLLELCCTPTPTLTGLSAFAAETCAADPAAYSVAACLLTWEVAARDASSGTKEKTHKPAMAAVFATVLHSVIRSRADLHAYISAAGPVFHSAWLHGVVDYAAAEGIPVSTVARRVSAEGWGLEEMLRQLPGSVDGDDRGRDGIPGGINLEEGETRGPGAGDLQAEAPPLLRTQTGYQCRACLDQPGERGRCEHCKRGSDLNPQEEPPESPRREAWAWVRRFLHRPEK